LEISHLDHLVLTVENIEATLRFYSEILGMTVIEFGQGRKALKFGRQKINLHEKGKEMEPKAMVPTVGSADLCFITKTPLNEVVKFLERHHIQVEEGPVQRTGALGQMNSIYLRDPSGNLIELSNY